MNKDLLQFYPTPYGLAQKATQLFKNRKFTRILEPSAGTGDLMQALLAESPYHQKLAWDAIELNIEHHPSLRDKGAQVVGFDFLKHDSCAIYSHILMNPPFNVGVQHVLHAWDTLFEGEIVAILNAQSIKNPNSSERTRLCELILAHGDVDFHEAEFLTEDTRRKTAVEVALIYLRKEASIPSFLEPILQSLIKADASEENLSEDSSTEFEVVIPKSVVENLVHHYQKAQAAYMTACLASVNASRYRSRFGQTSALLLANRTGRTQETPEETPGDTTPLNGAQIRDSFKSQLDELRDAAWVQVINSFELDKKLSSEAYARLLADFEQIKLFAFTVSNIYGFLAGISNSGGQIQLDMICEVFDRFTRYHSDNHVYFMGWKSNDRHRTAGYRLKMTRLILPQNFPLFKWSLTATWQTCQMLGDFDKVFAILDGVTKVEKGLRDLFENEDMYSQLKAGARLQSTYFDVRFYAGTGTIHLFPTNKSIIERLNRIVSQHRGWIPPQWEDASPDFKTHYDKADSFAAAVRKELLAQGGPLKDVSLYDLKTNDDVKQAQAHAQVLDALRVVTEKNGLFPMAAVSNTPSQKLLTE